MYLRRSSAVPLRNAVQNSVHIARILGATLRAARDEKMAPDFLETTPDRALRFLPLPAVNRRVAARQVRGRLRKNSNNRLFLEVFSCAVSEAP
jgi:hypothetical protein